MKYERFIVYSKAPSSSITRRRLTPGAILGVVLFATMGAAQAQTYTWADNAQGQIYEICSGTTNNWPSDNFWTDVLQTNESCNGTGIVTNQPSNWDPAPPIGVYPGGPGGIGADVVLGAPANAYLYGNATLDSMTILTNGALTLGPGTIAALDYYFQGDGVLSQAGNDFMTLLSGGFMEKSGGTNSYTIQPPVIITDGTVEVDSGTLVLSASLGYLCSNGTFNVSNNAALDLTGGSGALWSGVMTGSGSGHVLLSSGEIVSHGMTFNFPPNYFWWTGGNLGQDGQGNSTFTNAGAMTVFTAGGPFFSLATLYNEGLIVETNAGALAGGVLENEASGTWEFAGDGGIGPTSDFINYGLVLKSSGTGNSVINNSYNQGGIVEADTGTMTLAGNRSSSNGTFIVGTDAVVDLTGGDQPTWAGVMTGSGAGQVTLSSGNIAAASNGLVLNFPPGLFWWTGGGFAGTPPSYTVANSNTITVFAANAPNLGYTVLANYGLIQQTNGGNLTVGAFALVNESSGAYEFDGDGGGTSGGVFNNYGLLRKRYGTGTSVMGCILDNLGGTIEADSGTLVLGNSGNTDSSSSNGTFIVGADAVVDLTGGYPSAWAGVMTGSGAGQVLLASGEVWAGSNGPVLNFPPGLFWWTGGQFVGAASSSEVINSNTITILATNAPTLTGCTLYNDGLIEQTNGGNVGLALVNESSAAYDFDGDGGSTSGSEFLNYGLLRKRFGTGTSVMGCVLENLGGTIEADSGTLVVSNSSSASSNGTFIVGANAVVDLTGGDQPTWAGVMAGSGAGQVLLASGGITAASTGLVLNFPPGQFLWTGGDFTGTAPSYTVANSNTITILATNAPFLNYGVLANYGLIQQTNGGNLNVGAFWLANESSGTYEFDGDGGSTSGNKFYNYGLLRKRYGAGTSVMGCALNNLGGTIEADSGTLVLSNNSATSSNGAFIVGANALVDLTGGDQPTWAGVMTGSGAGRVLLASGGITAASTGLVLNFPPGQFLWTGGNFTGTAPSYTVANSNTITILATSAPVLNYSVLANYGLIQHTNGGNLNVGAFYLVNEASGAYEFDGDGGSASGNMFYNDGLLRKRYGTGVSTISSGFTNAGTIEVDSGTLSIPGGFSGTGALTIALGGNGAGQCGQLLVNGSATLNGPLKVILTNNFAPAATNQFQIVACGSLSGTFANVIIPSGLSVTYSNTGVYLVVTGPAPVTIQSPQLTNGNFSFAFDTQSNQSYVIQQSTNLATTNWVFFTNFTGTGDLMQFVTPLTNIAEQFFRVSEP
jgi:hypothetical protein